MIHVCPRPIRLFCVCVLIAAPGGAVARGHSAPSFMTASGWQPPSSQPARSGVQADASASEQPSFETARPSVAQTPHEARATYLLSSEYLHGDPCILWPGLLSGLRGFEHFYDPVGNPLYFESPFNTSQLRLIYLHHDFPDGSQLGGGDLNVYAAQIRVALSERWAFIATKDGYSDLNARSLPAEEGWNDFAIGFKYLLIVDRENDFVLTTGLRWTWENGDKEVLMGNTQELSPFLSFAKGFDRLHLLGNITPRVPCDRHDGNYVLQWDLHLDYEIAPETLPGLAPLVEVHGLHYLSDADRLPLAVGGLDYANIGAQDVSGSAVVWAGIGARWKLSPHTSIGSTFEFPLHNPDDDIMGNRVTVDLALNW